ncbi:chalcone isomerase family protein [Isoalcanivorax indicus]|uniref:chalcone isomerase family protein n=1 Tax=Isoalcanivorax indicus TaxID=2202653 RepID=UPI000DB9AF63|nr:chalcone isomerase family protein [Isoalcanivorax indicus]
MFLRWVSGVVSLIVLSGLAMVALAAEKLPAELDVDGTKLVLNGEGVRNRFFMDIYTAGLYLSETNGNAEEIVQKDAVQAVRLKITSSRVSRARFIDSIEDGIRKSAGDDFPRYAPFIDELREEMDAQDIQINVGDLFGFDYVPGEGTRILRNGEVMRVIEGLDFKQVLFGIYLGNDPIQDSLKREMLGEGV